MVDAPWIEGEIAGPFPPARARFVPRYSFLTTQLITAIREHLQLWLVSVFIKSFKVLVGLIPGRVP